MYWDLQQLSVVNILQKAKRQLLQNNFWEIPFEDELQVNWPYFYGLSIPFVPPSGCRSLRN